MRRNYLIEAASKAAVRLGYAFDTGPQSLVPARVRTMPSVWMLPPELISEEGRRECRTTYSVGFYFITSGRSRSGGDAESAIDRLERDAVGLYHALAEDAGIIRTFGLKCVPLGSPVSKDGWITVSVEMRVELFHCR